ncbi:MAG: hypothetical protein J6Q39_05090 [Bacteroidales bacterium]|jgi:hypothetical protein|nr:hypothetical protein [Bacteroidales bacterium]
MARSMVEHNFYCMNCGKKGIPLMRNKGFQHGKHHRKKLYCPFCKVEVNHVECKTYADVQDFLEAFERGDYKEEAAESMSFIESEKTGGM